MHRYLGRLLFERCSPRNAWAYLLWLLLAYAPLAVSAVAVNDDHRLLHSKHLFDALYLLPVAFALWQAFYPTLCGWLLFTVPTVLWTGFLLFLAVRCMLTTHLHGFLAQQDFPIGCILCGAAALASIALLYARPTPSTLTRVA